MSGPTGYRMDQARLSTTANAFMGHALSRPRKQVLINALVVINEANSRMVGKPEVIDGPRGQVLVCSIKGVKEKRLLLRPEFFLPSSPPH